MVESAVVHNRSMERGKTKRKTGCATCRIRKIKCDEVKPHCRKCVSTGRSCDGYESNFRYSEYQPASHAPVCKIRSDISLPSIRPTISSEITSQDIEVLNRYFSIKTLFDVKMGCAEEARQVLQACLTDLPVRHAVSSLKALREDLEIDRNGPNLGFEQTTGYNYGLQQYSMALEGLASNLSSSNLDLHSALLCCQILISIEQVRGNYAALVHHISGGLRIMHEYGARPDLLPSNILAPSHHTQLPLLDVFIIKLFIAPCRFAEAPSIADYSRTTSSRCSAAPLQQHMVDSRSLRMIAPNMRTELTRIASSTLTFLDKVSQVKSVGRALQLKSEKTALLDSLESWLVNLDLVENEIGLSAPGPISLSFMRIFHLILRVVLLEVLDSSPDRYARLRSEYDRLQNAAKDVSERVKAFHTRSNGTDSALTTTV